MSKILIDKRINFLGIAAAVEPIVVALEEGQKRVSSAESLRQLLQTVEEVLDFLKGCARSTKINRALKRKSHGAIFANLTALVTEGMHALELDVAVGVWENEDASGPADDPEENFGPNAMDEKER